LKEIQKRLDDNGKKLKLAVDEPACDWLGAAGYSREYRIRQVLYTC
jgi:hypothetical protein